MAGKQNTKSAPKTERTNTGVRGSRKAKQDPLSLIHMGKGAHKKTKRLGDKPFSVTPGREPFDAEQAKKNRLAGLG